MGDIPSRILPGFSDGEGKGKDHATRDPQVRAAGVAGLIREQVFDAVGDLVHLTGPAQDQCGRTLR